jgi:hypothetical protein
VNVGEHSDVDLFFDSLQHFQTWFHTETTEALDRRSVCFIERRFENVIEAGSLCAIATLASHHQRMLWRFDNAGTGDDREPAVAESGFANGE